MKDYPVWKKSLITGVRIFVGASLLSIATSISNGVALGDLLLPALIGGLTALGKFLREEVGKGDYNSFIYKLPM